MRKTNLKSILQVVVVLSVLAGLLLCMNGCKKKPADNGSIPTTDTPTGTTGSLDNTTPNKTPNPNEDTKPVNATTPGEDTKPADTTAPDEETVPNACIHTLGSWIVEKASTCTTEGSRYKECSLCKQKVETESIPTTPHTAGAWIVDKKATCTAEGIQHQECTQCKTNLIRIIVSKADHTTYIIKGYEATLGTPGLTQGRLCSVCGATVQDQYSISPLQHLEVTYEVSADEKTCTLTGLVDKNNEALILPDSINGYTITAIKDGAFSGCTALKTVYLPDTVTSIGAQAFSGCTALSNVTFEGTTTQWLAVTKGVDWNANTSNFKVYCSNNHLSK